MGQYFKIVNPAKREYLDPGCFGESIKLSTFPWAGLLAKSVTLLVCHIDPGSCWQDTLAGSWAGDTIIVAGDEQKEPNWYGFEPSPNEKSYYSLYEMALMEFGNVSHKAMAMLCKDEFVGDENGFMPDIVKQAKEPYERPLLLTLGNAVFEAGCKPLEEELLKQWGPEWIEKYEKAREDMLYRLG